MVKILKDTSRTFSEYLLLPQLTPKGLTSCSVDLKTPISKFKGNQKQLSSLNIPIVSASMQSVSGTQMAIALARQGGCGFIYSSQSIESQAKMIEQVKMHKAGFVISDSCLKPTDTLQNYVSLREKTNHSTMPVTKDGLCNGLFLGIITDKDFWEDEDNLCDSIKTHMTPKEKVITGESGISLKQANLLLYKYKKDCLPILEKNHLKYLVFTKDYIDHKNHPNEILDNEKRLIVGAAINTHDYKDRVPALIEKGVDVLCFDSSDGFTEYQKEAALWIRKKYGDQIILGGGNVVTAEGFLYLAKEAKLDFIKVGIGGGSICITREQKGIGRGQASSLLEVCDVRNTYFKETGIYIPVCSDGGLSNDTQIIIALSMGADFVMMGRYFAMTDESPTSKVSIKSKLYKPYWGEGSSKARNWSRYSNSDNPQEKLSFEEGIESYVPLLGSVEECLQTTLQKTKSTMVNLGSQSLKEFRNKAILTLVSKNSIEEGGTSTVLSFDSTNSSNIEDQ